jgi:DNA-binding MarR family transcriptional regulator
MPASEASVHRAIEGLARLAELVAERRRQLAREAGIAEPEWQLLEEISGERFMPSMFARRRAVSPAAVSRTLRALKTRGLAADAIAEGDARRRRYRLTPEGRRVLERLRASRAAAIAAIWEPLPASELLRFGRFAAELAERLEAFARRRAPARGAAGVSAAAAAPRGGRASAAATTRARARRARPR